jgi:hypothetical protein
LAAFGLFVALGLAAALLLLLLPVSLIFSWTGSSLLPPPPKGRSPAQGTTRRSPSRRPRSVVDSEASAAKRRTFSLKIAPGGLGLFVLASAMAVALSMAALLLIPPRLPSSWQGVTIGVLFAVGMIVPLVVEVWAGIGLSPRALRRMRRTLP